MSIGHRVCFARLGFVGFGGVSVSDSVCGVVRFRVWGFEYRVRMLGFMGFGALG